MRKNIVEESINYDAGLKITLGLCNYENIDDGNRIGENYSKEFCW